MEEASCKFLALPFKISSLASSISLFAAVEKLPNQNINLSNADKFAHLACLIGSSSNFFCSAACYSAKAFYYFFNSSVRRFSASMAYCLSYSFYCFSYSYRLACAYFSYSLARAAAAFSLAAASAAASS